MRKATLESQVAELSSKLSAVMQEKLRLENRNSILEKVQREIVFHACMPCKAYLSTYIMP